MTLNEIRDLVVNELEAMKAVDIRVIDVTSLTSFTDLIIIASGNSDRQVRALAGKVIDSAKSNDLKPLGTEGREEGDWALIDLGDVVVNIMRPETRDYYQLEKLWSAESARRSTSSRP